MHAGNKQQSRAANQYPYELHQSPPANLGQHINADSAKARSRQVVGQFGCGTRILRVVQGRDARATIGLRGD